VTWLANRTGQLGGQASKWSRWLPVGPSRLRLRRIALSYAEHGWDVLPGACFDGHRFTCGRALCQTVGCHPAIDDWETAATQDPARIADWWRRRPHALLLATGRAFDVLEVPAKFGRWALRSGVERRRSGFPGPVAAAPDGRWMFLVRPGQGLDSELSRRADVVLHAVNSWVPAPPTRQPSGQARWICHPRQVDFQPADPAEVQELIVPFLPAISPIPAPTERTRPAAIDWAPLNPTPTPAPTRPSTNHWPSAQDPGTDGRGNRGGHFTGRPVHPARRHLLHAESPHRPGPS